MNVEEFYRRKNDVLAKAFISLQASSQDFVPDLAVPEVLRDKLLDDWIRFSYLFMDIGFDDNPIFSEIGGIIPEHQHENSLVLAAAESSISKVLYGIDAVKRFQADGDEKILQEAQHAIGKPIRMTDSGTVVDGTRNIAHYDFSTRIAPDLLDTFEANLYLLFAAGGLNVVTSKCIRNEQYIFWLPMDSQLIRRAKSEKQDPAGFVPEDFIAGVHITYAGKKIIIRPVVGEREATKHAKYLKSENQAPYKSRISHLGMSYPDGRFTVMERSSR
ncbi:MAG: hypothetical protein HY517_02965 [Candidatus Aenigmarchaeota archaeon]|nr:hypothetical protein [Candidatus Aenigmarchaeota archaeon]